MSKKINDGLTAKQRYNKRKHEKALIIKCACGCETEIKSIDKHGVERRYVSGHHSRTKPKGLIDLKKPEFAYFYGFIQADAHLSLEKDKDKGKLAIEIKADDSSLLEKFHDIIPYKSSLSERERDTNFKKNYKSSILTVYNQGFRHELLALGMKYGKKSNTADIPKTSFSKIDFFRGMIDGDGSVGLTKNGYPFISLTTASDSMKEAYIEFLKSITGKDKEINRNSRDNIYNISLYKEDAQKVASVLYYSSCIGLERKKEKVAKMMLWERPKDMIKIPNRKNWKPEQDNYILTHTIEESMIYLKRSEKSVKMRLHRLKKGLI